MSRGFKITIIGLALILEFLFFALFCNPYPHGMIADVRYRHAKRLTTLRDYVEHHSADTRAAYDHELALMHSHEDWKGYSALGLLVAINGAVIYFFLRYEHRTPAA